MIHPSVYYVFSDDDPEVVTAASLRSLGADEVANTTLRRIDSEGQGLMRGYDEQEEITHDAALPPPRPGVVERYVLMDMGADGTTVQSARSLSADWAVTGTKLRSAPTFDDRDAAGDVGGLMLKVEGMDAGEPAAHGRREHEIRAEEMFESRKKALGGDNVAAMGQLVEGLKKGMETLGRVVVDAGEDVEKSQDESSEMRP